MKLNISKRTKKRVITRSKQPLIVFNQHNRVWALDFLHDALYHGRRFRVLNIIDESNREAFAIEPGFSIPAARLIRMMNRLVDFNGLPDGKPLRQSGRNGRLYISPIGRTRGTQHMFIQPGKPDQNAFAERFNPTFWHEVLTLNCLHQCGK